MAFKYSTRIDSALYDKEGLCPGINLRRHEAGDLEEVGAFRAQEDWRRLVGPLEKPYAGLLGPDFSFVTAAVPECLPERIEIVSYALEFGFIHDDVIDKEIEDASLDEMENALEQGGQSGQIEEKGASGMKKIVAQILRDMMAIDPERAMTVAKSWAAGVGHSNRRQEDAQFNTLEEYLPYRAFDVGYMLWHGLVLFGCGITVPDEEADEARRLITPALLTASLTNDLFSFEKERGDVNVQNAVLVVMREHGCSEEEAREVCKQRIRIECANYVRHVKEIQTRTDVSDELKRYIDTMQYTLSANAAWSTNCPRYNGPTKFNELQLLRAKYGLEKYPAMWLPKDATNGYSVKEPFINGNGHYEPTKTNGLKRKRDNNNTGDTKRLNGTNGVNGVNDVKKPALGSQPSTDSFVLADVVSLALDQNLLMLSDNVVLEPYRYLTSLPSKGFRDQAIDSLNTWLKVPSTSARTIKNIIKMLHSASLMLDDIEDGSPLRRGKPSTHSIYGTAQTINSATYQYTEATGVAAELSNPACLRIFVEEVQQLYVGQSYDLYWTHHILCPSISEYLKMVDMKTGGLFRLLTRLMIAESPVSDAMSVSDNALNQLSCLIGRFFQIRDDYQNLASADYAKQKGFAEDLDEGKFSFPLIHSLRTVESEPKFAGDAMQLRAFLMKRRLEGELNNEAKREVLAIMKKTKSLEYTLSVLRELHGELKKEVGRLEEKFGEENFSLTVMLEMLKV
ncbi:geranylgeranyl pyrophosphate synthase [Penicillium canariense]|uniref:Geranylgeranyl pyrophosphate synthase n=1 Tax=Penicillium canariense TaxID=189055 RepID=A0A9W9LJM4_9EURO|nr:geranylgeranyl pyrophosphate synthase [Penicillium canariense]KAJ5159723.1 geranylgeranyl pyrophosphate synthase [Penicillium canariense]